MNSILPYFSDAKTEVQTKGNNLLKATPWIKGELGHKPRQPASRAHISSWESFSAMWSWALVWWAVRMLSAPPRWGGAYEAIFSPGLFSVEGHEKGNCTHHCILKVGSQRHRHQFLLLSPSPQGCPSPRFFLSLALQASCPFYGLP